MTIQGGCYCRALRYEVQAEPMMKAQCHCRECQYITGGGPNFFMIVPADGFRVTQGEAREFTRSDLEKPVTRLFCPTCGTHVATRPARPGVMVVKIGTLDDPARDYGGPQMAIFTVDKAGYHVIPDGLPAFERRPG